MSLYDFGIMDEMMEPFTKLERKSADQADGGPGWTETYKAGETFRAMLLKNSSTEAQVAQRQGLKEFYTVVVPKGVALRHNDVIRKDATGETYRVTSDVHHSEAPPSSTVPIAKVTAEPWALVGEVVS